MHQDSGAPLWCWIRALSRRDVDQDVAQEIHTARIPTNEKILLSRTSVDEVLETLSDRTFSVRREEGRGGSPTGCNYDDDSHREIKWVALSAELTSHAHDSITREEISALLQRWSELHAALTQSLYSNTSGPSPRYSLCWTLSEEGAVRSGEI